MTERDWVGLMAKRIMVSCIGHSKSLHVKTGMKLPYGYEIVEYADRPSDRAIEYETDLVITESTGADTWKPRIVVECKINSISTHDAITYSQKAACHKSVHPYLRYGVTLGCRKQSPLPGRLYRHGAFFDFMLSFKGYEPTKAEMNRMTSVIHEEIEASRRLERILYESRKKNRDHYVLLHRKLHLE